MENLKEFTEDQKAAYKAMVEFSENEDRMMLLSGYAGTGKTYLAAKFVQEVGLFKDILITAPTHKALKVLKDKVGIDYDYSTIHASLALKEQISADGSIFFKADKFSQRDIENYQIIIVDEASMIDNDIFNQLCEVSGLHLKILFIGDPKQIPPVNHPNAQPFDPDVQIQYGIKVETLNEIVRQEEGSDIIEVSMHIRENWKEPINFGDLSFSGSDQVKIIYRMHDPDYVFELIESEFKSERFSKSSDYCKLLAWTNNCVDGFNRRIRQMLWGEGTPGIVVGESLVMNAPFKTVDNDLKNNEELEVLEVDSHIYKDIFCYSLTVWSKADEIEKKIYCVHEDGYKEFKAKEKSIKQSAIKKGTKQAWKFYYEFKRQFAEVKYSYALTVHKSQGSTYDRAIIIESDIARNPNVKERNRILYTAVTRAREKTTIII